MTTKSSRLTPEREKEIRDHASTHYNVRRARMFDSLLAEIDALRAENELVRDKLLAMAQEHAVWEKHSLCEIVKERDRLREALEKYANYALDRSDEDDGGESLQSIAKEALGYYAQAASNTLNNCPHGVLPIHCYQCKPTLPDETCTNSEKES